MIKELTKSALQNHIAILGKTGSGKTSTEKLIVEQVVKDGFHVCILDSVKTDWWGITSSANGKQAGLPFKILGGPRGHVPLHSSAGKVIGQLVGSGKLPLSIIDMADFEAGGLQRFFVDFAQSLMRNARGVIYLVIEEAHEFAPKERSGIGAENLAIHWAKKLATAGRSKGIRLIVATQRIQALHNAVLGSCETIIAHRLSAPADQEPIVKWLKANTDKGTEAKVSSSLSSLPTGTGWLCSGEAKVFKMMKFPKFSTYDNTATPIGDADEITVKTAPVDHDELRSIIGEAVIEAEANDPAKLKAKIRELEKRGVAEAPMDPQELVKASDEGYRIGKIDGYRAGYDEGVANFENNLEDEKSLLADAVFQKLKGMTVLRPKVSGRSPPLPHMAAHSIATKPPPSAAPRIPSPRRTDDTGLRPAEQRVVDALGFWLSVGNSSPTRAQVAAVSGYSVKSSGFEKTISQLSSKGVLSRPVPGALTLTDTSKASPLNGSAARDRLYSVLGPAQRRVMEAFDNATSTREEIATRSNYSPTSSGFEKTLSQLSSIGIVIRPAPGMVDLSGWVRELL